MKSQVFVRRLDLVRLRMWGEKLNLLSRLSVMERGLLICTSENRGIVKFQNAKLVRQLRLIVRRLGAWIPCAKKLRILAQNARKYRWKAAGSLAGIIQKRGYVPGDYALGDAGLRGEALHLYCALKHGSLPTLSIYLWNAGF